MALCCGELNVCRRMVHQDIKTRAAGIVTSVYHGVRGLDIW